ncbi:SIMPL domain-containing protein [Candidatus Saccharibacteria bacterium]|nr:SIMPL domain-containing protein [Candidatus Saccharibacteria bacterium]
MADTKGSVTLRFDYRWLIGMLLLVIAVMVLMWRPWEPRYDKDSRTVEATGEMTIKAVPDEFAFYPVYNFKNSDKAVALADSSKKNDEVVKKLKELGVSDNKIKSSVNGYQDVYMTGTNSGEYVYSVSLTVTLTDKDVAQKVQNYLVSTGPEGGVSPQPTFSEAKRKELEKTARDGASKDARKKAEQLVSNLGGRLGDVKSITDGNGFGGIIPMYATAAGAADKDVSSITPLALQPGENELMYTVSVTYYLR